MQYRVLKAASLVAALVPTLAIAQQRPAATPPATAPRPATPPAQQPRPAAAPAQRPAAMPARPMAGPHRDQSWEFTIQGAVFPVDQAFNAKLDQLNIADPAPSRIMIGGHASLTKNFSSHVGFGIGAGFGTGNGATTIQPTVDLTFTTNLNKSFGFFVPVGANLSRFSRSGGNRVTSTIGLHGGLGFRAFLSDNMALRVEGRMAYEKYDEQTDPAYNAQGRVGLSFFLGGTPPKDTDMDGVMDKKDRCAATPRGAMVDANGCPRDADRDGVFDGLDRCANTPANTPVDATGCPRDTDRDGVNDAADRCPNTTAGTPVDANGCPRDADGDGVADNLDRCANTPRGTPVDANGCPRDADGDGVADGNDRCPNTPAGTAVDANGCPRDTDGDGVADGADRCAGTPAGTRVDANGCPLAPDADRDGVEDARDRCPNTPAGRNVDANGCPLAELPAVGASLVIRNINFVTGRANLTAASAQPLRDVAVSMQAVLRQSSSSRFEVAGYTDNRGAAAANRRLSQSRADAVKAALVTAGVPASALTAVGYGPDSPKAPNTTAAGRAQNRRVEVKRLS
jgi:outer membrane protein OmpA-like peptidoglycan-associated protein